jgi:hypothetical protein
MNPSWYTGKMPVEMLRSEHPDDPALQADSRMAISRRDEASSTRPDDKHGQTDLKDK